MTTAEPRNVALQFATHKVPTFPVRVSRLGDRWLKRPHISEWATRATYSKAQITEWWHCWPNAMVGVPLARVGLVVVDADRHPGAADGVPALRAIELPPHPIITTRSGGEHHFFRQPNSQLRFARWAGGEILGVGRFVVGYDLAPFVSEVPQWLEWLMESLPRKTADARPLSASSYFVRPRGAPATDIQSTGSVLLRSRYLLRGLERTGPGNRHALLYWTACRFGNMVGEGKIKTEVAEQLLLCAAQANGSWQERPDNCLQTIWDGLREGEEEWRRAVA